MKTVMIINELNEENINSLKNENKKYLVFIKKDFTGCDWGYDIIKFLDLSAPDLGLNEEESMHHWASLMHSCSKQKCDNCEHKTYYEYNDNELLWLYSAYTEIVNHKD